MSFKYELNIVNFIGNPPPFEEVAEEVVNVVDETKDVIDEIVDEVLDNANNNDPENVTEDDITEEIVNDAYDDNQEDSYLDLITEELLDNTSRELLEENVVEAVNDYIDRNNLDVSSNLSQSVVDRIVDAVLAEIRERNDLPEEEDTTETFTTASLIDESQTSVVNSNNQVISYA
jgi:uncharacterized membrane-anchored protein YjiN (DUF445 family)